MGHSERMIVTEEYLRIWKEADLVSYKAYYRIYSEVLRETF
jgi:hypothetical protein